MASNLRFQNPAGIAKPGGYTHVVEAIGPGRIVYIAGQLGLKPDGAIAACQYHGRRAGVGAARCPVRG